MQPTWPNLYKIEPVLLLAVVTGHDSASVRQETLPIRQAAWIGEIIAQNFASKSSGYGCWW